jgi:hypothetical protein
MRHLNLPFYCSVLLLCIIGCSDSKEDVSPENAESQTCFSGKSIKKVKNQKGTIYYDLYEKRYAVYVSIPGTVDSQDVGFLCDNLNTLKKDNLSITFTGEYHSYLEDRKPPVGGQKYYFLEIKKFKILTGQ